MMVDIEEVHVEQAGSGDEGSDPNRPSKSERLVSRVEFLDQEGRHHTTSVWSTKPLDFVLGTDLAAERIEQFKAIYEAQGYRVLRVEFIDQIGWELGR